MFPTDAPATFTLRLQLREPAEVVDLRLEKDGTLARFVRIGLFRTVPIEHVVVPSGPGKLVEGTSATLTTDQHNTIATYLLHHHGLLSTVLQVPGAFDAPIRSTLAFCTEVFGRPVNRTILGDTPNKHAAIRRIADILNHELTFRNAA